MSRRWIVYEGSPNAAGGGKDKPRVTLSRKKVFLLNRRAYEVLGSPAAVEFRFEEETRTIGLRPRDLRLANAFPIKGTAHKGRSYRIISGAPFCRQHEIAPDGTLLFTGVDLDDDGTMLLEMETAVRVGRGSR